MPGWTSVERIDASELGRFWQDFCIIENGEAEESIPFIPVTKHQSGSRSCRWIVICVSGRACRAAAQPAGEKTDSQGQKDDTGRFGNSADDLSRLITVLNRDDGICLGDDRAAAITGTREKT